MMRYEGDLAILRVPNLSEAVIPGRISEDGFSENLVNPESGFRHSDPESIHENYGNPKAVIPGRMSEVTKAVIPGRMNNRFCDAGFP
ncbi:hypothetical protein QUF72_20865 [Desulfobacterales bacterium HSG2]|nr:hypothetical protein [Desulfobacterales bacterium HSG2]